MFSFVFVVARFKFWRSYIIVRLCIILCVILTDILDFGVLNPIFGVLSSTSKVMLLNLVVSLLNGSPVCEFWRSSFDDVEFSQFVLVFLIFSSCEFVALVFHLLCVWVFFLFSYIFWALRFLSIRDLCRLIDELSQAVTPNVLSRKRGNKEKASLPAENRTKELNGRRTLFEATRLADSTVSYL